ncbi:MAG: hypothetical protein V4444_03695 [Pseudomonadota bacterium]
MGDNADLIRNNFLKTVAWQNSWSAAVRRNRLYRAGAEPDRKEALRELVRLKVEAVCERCRDEEIGEDQFVDEVNLLACAASRDFADILDHAFNIGTAQKVLSVYLKFNWIFGLCKMPPLAPVDRLIQKIPVSWTKLDSLENYRRIIDLLKAEAKEEPLAEWELRNYQLRTSA